MKVNPVMIIVLLLLLSTCVTAVVAENCRIKNDTKCANGSTIALTVVLALLVAVTAPFWIGPVFTPPAAVLPA